ncbi:putative transcription initiation factor TFIID subunit 10 [Blattamonas nauphoetae]|uniref:Transcription initiation factor TFIID subunit 10 n=1 Tax=Blattamonas nauphoetae TaxID=2049346 RepID=A0ABQ9XXU2_9EUKA|nr:putative transcription initiation factor TFIID subunit 10 [Blattamonas nauphoetae]
MIRSWRIDQKNTKYGRDSGWICPAHIRLDDISHGKSSSTIPNQLIDYYLQTAGVKCTDSRIHNMVAVATEKFLSDILSEAFTHSQTKHGKEHPEKTTLTMDSLESALDSYGIDIHTPKYYADSPMTGTFKQLPR